MPGHESVIWTRLLCLAPPPGCYQLIVHLLLAGGDIVPVLPTCFQMLVVRLFLPQLEPVFRQDAVANCSLSDPQVRSTRTEPAFESRKLLGRVWKGSVIGQSDELPMVGITPLVDLSAEQEFSAILCKISRGVVGTPEQRNICLEARTPGNFSRDFSIRRASKTLHGAGLREFDMDEAADGRPLSLAIRLAAARPSSWVQSRGGRRQTAAASRLRTTSGIVKPVVIICFSCVICGGFPVFRTVHSSRETRREKKNCSLFGARRGASPLRPLPSSPDTMNIAIRPG